MAHARALQVGQNSTTSLRKIEQYLVQFTVPAMSSNTSVESTVTVTGLSTSDHLLFTARQTLNTTVVGVVIAPRCSTANELVLTISNNSVSSLSGSTQSGLLLAISVI